MLTATYKPFMLNVVMLNFVMLSVVMLCVVVPKSARRHSPLNFSVCNLQQSVRVFIHDIIIQPNLLYEGKVKNTPS